MDEAGQGGVANNFHGVSEDFPYQETQDQLPDGAAAGQGAALQSVLELISSCRC